MNYEDFLAGKSFADVSAGFDVEPDNHALFPFQRDIVRWALRRGRAAIFADTGLGKTLMQVVWAREVAMHTGGDVLIFAPLCVAQQTVEEAHKFGVDVTYARHQRDVAHIDIRRAHTAGAIWRFAGLDPTQKWNKGQRRPYNARLKTLCWKIGESFCKVQNHPGDTYGKIYRERKTLEWVQNLDGAYAEQATNKLATHRIDKNTDAYHWYAGMCSPDKAMAKLESGDTPTVDACLTDSGLPMLPPAHIDQRAKRYAVKLFLSHLHHRWWEETYNAPPPVPYVIAHGGHAHFIEPPQCKAG